MRSSLFAQYSAVSTSRRSRATGACRASSCWALSSQRSRARSSSASAASTCLASSTSPWRTALPAGRSAATARSHISASCSRSSASWVWNSARISELPRRPTSLTSVRTRQTTHYRRDQTISYSAGELDHGDEEVVDVADHLDEPVEVDRLAHVGVGVQAVAAHDVLLRLGGGQHDDRDHAQLGVVLELGQHLAAVAAREVQVEQDQAGPRRVGVLALLAQELQRLLAVVDDVEAVADLVVLERLLGHQDVAVVVLDQQHVDNVERDGFSHRCRSPLQMPP